MACVDTDKRAACAANHSATHLLDEALREVLGEHVEQKGSLVTPDSLRFDFSHLQKVTDEELRKVEHLVNAKIRANVPLQEHRNIPIEEAKELGAIALFGEKYGDHVRVIQFGSSIEFCGGTHVAATGNIGMVKIISESSVAAGVRRIEAYTGARVEEMLDTIQDTLSDLKALFFHEVFHLFFQSCVFVDILANGHTKVGSIVEKSFQVAQRTPAEKCTRD